MVAACLIFSCLDASAKYVVQNGMAAPFVAWVRFVVHVLVVLVLFRAWTNFAIFRVGSVPMQVLRALCLFGSTFFNFLALWHLQLAETISINFFSPMLITVLAGPLLGEWAGWRRWVAVLVGLIGVLVITRPGFGTFGIGHVFALAAMSSHSLYAILTRRMGASETSESLIFYSALTPAILMLPVVPAYASMPPDAFLWLILLSIGLYGALGHYLLILAYKQATATSLAPYPYSQMIWMVGLGYLVFGDIPDLWTLVGAAIIVASGLYIVHRERRLRLASRSAPTAESEELAKKL